MNMLTVAVDHKGIELNRYSVGRARPVAGAMVSPFVSTRWVANRISQAERYWSSRCGQWHRPRKHSPNSAGGFPVKILSQSWYRNAIATSMGAGQNGALESTTRQIKPT